MTTIAFLPSAPLLRALGNPQHALSSCKRHGTRRIAVITASASHQAPKPQSNESQEPPPPLSFRDSADLFVHNFLVNSGLRSDDDGTPVADGDITQLVGDTPFFINLHRMYSATGPVFKLSFGPKLFIVVQDPVAVRFILRENSILFEKGILAEILDEIMGSGLIPADYETWKVRRRAIAPGFHNKWLSFMTSQFSSCADRLVDKLARIADTPAVVDMETEYSSVALDIVGKAVFNYDFNSVASESPVIKAVYRLLKEAEHRSTVFLPYWKIPGAKQIVPRLRAFYADRKLINDTLNELIRSAKSEATEDDLDDLLARDYTGMSDPSLLRFLVELRGEQTTNKQLRDDLMTLLIAGHETVAAVLTWATVELAKNPDIVARARAEIDSVLGPDTYPTYEDVMRMPLIRRIIAETLRLYPEPPVLIRRLLSDTRLPNGGTGESIPLRRGTDVFINAYSLHRSPDLWNEPDRFDPDRWLYPSTNPGIQGWAGYNPPKSLDLSRLYPNEVNADFAFIPFGGGSRKCVGDGFAVLEAVVTLTMVLRKFDFEFADSDGNVKMTTGATIHTDGGLNMRVKRRIAVEEARPVSIVGRTTVVTPVTELRSDTEKLKP